MATKDPIQDPIFDKLYRLKRDYKPYAAYCTANRILTLRFWNGHYPVDKNMVDRQVAAGATLKIVMVSRFDDFGLTDNLDADHGYGIRLPIGTDAVSDFRWEP